MRGPAPFHQTNWDWRAAGNFIGGGNGAGLMLAAALAAAAGLPFWAGGAVGIAFVSIGLLCVWLEIGRPWRAIHVFFHPQTSWMTRESIVGVPLLATAFAAVVLSFLDGPLAWIVPVLLAVGALLAGTYLYCQARILKECKGIPAWRHPALMPVMMITGLVEGAGLLAIVTLFAGEKGLAAYLALALAVLIVVRGGLWFIYRRRLGETGAPSKSLDVLDQAGPRLMSGHGAALAALALAGVGVAPAAMIVVGGLAAILSGWYLKYVVIARAAYNQGFALPNLPVRGAGEAGPGAQPGWRGPDSP